MGYTTIFKGEFKFDRPVTEELAEYINRFSATRRMPRDNEKIKKIYPNWKELCFNGELGNYGEYFAARNNDCGQESDGSILDYNNYKLSVHPGLWCQWIVSGDRKDLRWDGGEKFCNYVKWLDYLIANFFEPLGYVLNGDVEFQGEEYDDCGIIHVENNEVTVLNGEPVYPLMHMHDEALVDELSRRGYEVNKI